MTNDHAEVRDRSLIETTFLDFRMKLVLIHDFDNSTGTFLAFLKGFASREYVVHIYADFLCTKH